MILCTSSEIREEGVGKCHRVIYCTLALWKSYGTWQLGLEMWMWMGMFHDSSPFSILAYAERGTRNFGIIGLLGWQETNFHFCRIWMDVGHPHLCAVVNNCFNSKFPNSIKISPTVIVSSEVADHFTLFVRVPHSKESGRLQRPVLDLALTRPAGPRSGTSTRTSEGQGPTSPTLTLTLTL